jgi:hypothetical protein
VCFTGSYEWDGFDVYFSRRSDGCDLTTSTVPTATHKGQTVRTTRVDHQAPHQAPEQRVFPTEWAPRPPVTWMGARRPLPVACRLVAGRTDENATFRRALRCPLRSVLAARTAEPLGLARNANQTHHGVCFSVSLFCFELRPRAERTERPSEVSASLRQVEASALGGWLPASLAPSVVRRRTQSSRPARS